MRTVRVWVTVAACVSLTWCVPLASAAAGSAPCTPGSGKDLHGRRVTVANLRLGTSLACANLVGADLSGQQLVQLDLSHALLRDADLRGADLGQADLTGADLSGARMAGADLTQATLDDAELQNADLTDAHLGQVDARRADFTGANLSGVDFTQAHLDGAHLDRADIDGATFTQAYLDGTRFDGARGLPDYAKYVLGAALALYVLMVIGVLSRYLRRRTGYRLVPALLGRLIVVFGLHLFVGWLLGTIVSASGPPIDQLCHGPQCAVGVSAGAWAAPVGVLTILAGAVVAARGTVRTRRTPTPEDLQQLAAMQRALAQKSGVSDELLRQVQQKLAERMAAASSGSAAATVAPPTAPSAPTPSAPSVPTPAAPDVPVAANPTPAATVPPPIVPSSVTSAGSNVSLTPEQSLLPPEVLQLALSGRKREAMKKYREMTGSSRWEAKSVLEGL